MPCINDMEKNHEMEMKNGKKFMKRKLRRFLNKDGFITGNYKCF